jgi:hypothetical protein
MMRLRKSFVMPVMRELSLSRCATFNRTRADRDEWRMRVRERRNSWHDRIDAARASPL